MTPSVWASASARRVPSAPKAGSAVNPSRKRCTDLLRQATELITVSKISREENDATHPRMGEALKLLIGCLQAFDINNEGTRHRS
jgi:hypothetical protein